MTLKKYLPLLLPLLIWYSCNKSNDLDAENSANIEDCQIGEFYARMLLNGECKVPEFAWVIIDNMGSNTDIIGFGDSGQFDELLRLDFIGSFKVGKKILFSEADPKIFFSVNEGADAVITSFHPNYRLDTDANWVVIDSINADTSIVTGRFEAKLYKSNQTELYPSPDILNITEGQFRVKRKE